MAPPENYFAAGQLRFKSNLFTRTPFFRLLRNSPAAFLEWNAASLLTFRLSFFLPVTDGISLPSEFEVSSVGYGKKLEFSLFSTPFLSLFSSSTYLFFQAVIPSTSFLFLLMSLGRPPSID